MNQRPAYIFVAKVRERLRLEPQLREKRRYQFDALLGRYLHEGEELIEPAQIVKPDGLPFPRQRQQRPDVADLLLRAKRPKLLLGNRAPCRNGFRSVALRENPSQESPTRGNLGQTSCDIGNDFHSLNGSTGKVRSPLLFIFSAHVMIKAASQRLDYDERRR